MTSRSELPPWVDIGLIPVLNLIVAFIMAGLVVLVIGENPLRALSILLGEPLFSLQGWCNIFYYTTNFIFTGLCVAVAFHAGLFNIGGEGQAYVAGIGAATPGLLIGGALATFLPSAMSQPITLLICLVCSFLVGGLWGLFPGYLQAKRGSHIVITTIMLNFIAASVMQYMINRVYRPVGSQAVESRAVNEAYIWNLREIGKAFGAKLPSTPLTPVIFLALITAFCVWYLLWSTKLGYEIRAVGANQDAALYAGINPSRIIMITMLISGGLAGLVAFHEVLGTQHRLVLEYVQGAGFVGIAVALMGRSHPIGIVLAALLFGLLSEGGTQLSFEIQSISKDLIVVIQGLVVLFMGALEQAFHPWLQKFFKQEA